jgi:hypothetical protein
VAKYLEMKKKGIISPTLDEDLISRLEMDVPKSGK